MRIESELPHGKGGPISRYPYDDIASVVNDGKWAVLNADDYDVTAVGLRNAVAGYAQRNNHDWRVAMRGSEVWIGPDND